MTKVHIPMGDRGHEIVFCCRTHYLEYLKQEWQEGCQSLIDHVYESAELDKVIDPDVALGSTFERVAELYGTRNPG